MTVSYSSNNCDHYIEDIILIIYQIIYQKYQIIYQKKKSFKVKATTTEFLKGNKILMKEQITLHQRDIFCYKEYLHVAVS